MSSTSSSTSLDGRGSGGNGGGRSRASDGSGVSSSSPSSSGGRKRGYVFAPPYSVAASVVYQVGEHAVWFLVVFLFVVYEVGGEMRGSLGLFFFVSCQMEGDAIGVGCGPYFRSWFHCTALAWGYTYETKMVFTGQPRVVAGRLVSRGRLVGRSVVCFCNLIVTKLDVFL